MQVDKHNGFKEICSFCLHSRGVFYLEDGGSENFESVGSSLLNSMVC
jgi:hypothetical protein